MEQWECLVINGIKNRLNVPYSDALAIFEANEFKVMQCWAKGLTDTETINILTEPQQ